MSSKQTMNILLKLPGSDFENATQPFNTHLGAYIDQMSKIVAGDGPLSQVQAVRDYAAYCRWPIRQLEYSFAIGCLPSAPNGGAFDIGSGVTPWPYLLAGRGWPTISVDLEVEQVDAMRRHGLDAFGHVVDHRVADARGLGFADEQFSVVTCLSVLEHLQHADVPVAVAEMIRVCRPGGRIILTVDVRAADDPGVFKGEWAFPAATLEQIFRPVAEACNSVAEFETAIDAQRKLLLSDLEAFWTQHWKTGLWQEQNRGYGALGLVFDLPSDPQKCRDLVVRLREIALTMEYPPAGEPYHQVELPDGQRLWMLEDPVFTSALASDNFESDVHGFFEHFLRSGDTVFDVGANVGLYEAMLSRLVGPTGQIYAFEPTGQVFGCLVRNSLTSTPIIRLNRIGLSHENGSLTLLHGNDGNACLNSFGEPFGAGAASGGNYDSEVVWVTTLDDYVRDYAVSKIDVLKIDVEGWEERVLRGGLRTLLARSPVLVLEYCSPAARNAGGSCVAISELLVALEYELFRYEPESRSLEAVDPGRDAWGFANFIAIKRRALSYAIERLKGETIEPYVAAQRSLTAPASANDSEQVRSRDNESDQILLLEENRSLRQRLISGILDKEVTTLYHDLQISNADRAARLAVIEQQGAELSRIPTLEADVAYLKSQIASIEASQLAQVDHFTTQISALEAQLSAISANRDVIEADRAARLEVIERQGAELGRIPALEADVAYLKAQIAAAEADRAARLAVIERQGSELGQLQHMLAQTQQRMQHVHALLGKNKLKYMAGMLPVRWQQIQQLLQPPIRSSSTNNHVPAPEATPDMIAPQPLDPPERSDLEAYSAAISQFNSSQSNAPLLNSIRLYNHTIIETFDSMRPLHDKKLLDIGASPHGYALERALALGVAEYVGIGLDVEQSVEIQAEKGLGRLLYMNAEQLDFPDQSFDLVVSLSTFEHVGDVPRVLAEIKRVLKLGGSALITFEPIWTCSYGHHLHHFGPIAAYMPDWAHLLWDANQMRAELAAIWPADGAISLDEAIDWIYKSPVINRIDIVQMREYFAQSGMQIEWIAAIPDQKRNPARLRVVEAGTTFSAADLMTKGLSVFLNRVEGDT